MKSCCVPLCENDTYNRPDLKYFPLPKKVNVRKEWLEVLGIKGEYGSQQISICEIHFRDVDFRAGRKDLKVHAVPVLCIQRDVIDNISGEEFIPLEADCKPEEQVGTITEEPSEAAPSSAKKRRKADDEIIIKQEPETEPASETGRRPSRRAALVAAKKISSTVRQCDVKDDPGDPTLHLNSPSPRTPTSSRKSKVDHAKQNKVELDLEMICEDEELSSIQCTFLKLAQDEYNLALKNLRELAACNVRIIQEGDKARHIDLNAPINLFAPKKSLFKAQNKVKCTPRSTQVVPIFAKSPAKPNIPIIYL